MTLIDRLSKLDGPDREVEFEVHRARFPNDAVFGHKVPAYTTSVDAAIALAERVLPGCDLTIRSREKMAWIDGYKGQISYGATPAIAACIAILRAKEAKP